MEVMKSSGPKLQDKEGQRVLRKERGEREDVHLDLDAESLTEEAHGLETLLVVGSTATNEDADLVLLDAVLELLEGSDDTLEGSGDVGEVGDTTTDEEDLALGVRSTAGHEVDYGGEEGELEYGGGIERRQRTYGWSWRTRTSGSESAHPSTHRSWRARERNREQRWRPSRRRKLHHRQPWSRRDPQR